MKKFEYKIISETDFISMGDQNKGAGSEHKFKRDIGVFKKLAKDGWELVSVSGDNDYYFKREKK